MPLQTKFGSPYPGGRNDSLDSVLIVEPTLGFDSSHPSVNIQPGGTPFSQNFVIRDGAIEPRPMLVAQSSNQQPVDRVLGGFEIVNVTGTRYPFVTGSTQPAFYAAGTWSALSYVSAYGIDNKPAGSNLQYYDVTQIYDANANEMLAVFGNDSYQTLYCWQAGATTFSSLTGAPKARRVTSFENYLVAFNVQEPTGTFVQRVKWNDRGSNSSWTGGLSGFADLLDMRGSGTRIMAQENSMVLFSEYETWEGTPVAFPFIFDFHPRDRSVGCPYAWTAAATPQGIMFLGKDYNVYLISKWGGPARSVGDTVQKYIRDNIDQPTRAWATYDNSYHQYQLYFASKGGSGFPREALFLNLGAVQYSPLITQVGQGAWAYQSFAPIDRSVALTRGFEAQLSSSATSWGGLTAQNVTWSQLNLSWADLSGAGEVRATFAGSSNGTMFRLDSAATADLGLSTECVWESSALFGFQPNRQKTMDRIRIDYQAPSASTITLSASRNQGASFDPGFTLVLPANSAMSEAVAHFYAAARYPMFKISSDGERYRFFRAWLKVHAGGR